MSPIYLNSSKYDWFYAAILFGHDENLSEKTQIKSFITLGLYHLIVVSGSHLVAIEKIISLIPINEKLKKILKLIILFLFTAANLFQPACLRSFIQWFLQSFLNRFLIHRIYILFLSIIICLLLKPAFYKSISFQLSSLAGLALFLSSTFDLKNLGKVYLCTLLTTPLLLNIKPCVSGLIIILNLFALPILEITLLPLSLVCYFAPFLKPLVEPYFDLIFSFATKVSQISFFEVCYSQQRSSVWGFLILLLLYYFSYLAAVAYKRHLFKKSMNLYFGTLVKEI